MKNFWTYCCFLQLLIVVIICSCSSGSQTVVFRGIYVDDVDGYAALYNPERGFRLETAVDVSLDRKNPIGALQAINDKYKSDSITLTQSYFYLTYTIGHSLTEQNLYTIQQYFNELERMGMKAIVRFAYERSCSGDKHIGPTLEQALSHLEQLKPLLDKNKDLIMVVQAGIIGAWGEWHSSVHGLENSKECMTAILKKVLEVVPHEKQVQVRVPEYKNLLKDFPELYERISFHDDFIVIRPDKWDGNMHEGTPNFNQMVEESPRLIVDGELPWGFWSVGADPNRPAVGWIIDGMQTARRLFMQHYTSLSIIHNYKENEEVEDAPEYSMKQWKKTLITEDTLRKYRMPISDGYFITHDGKSVKRNVFDYIRDHLGYRIELQKLTFPSVWNGKVDNKLHLELINRGFATVFGNHKVYYVLIDKEGKVKEFPIDATPDDWYVSDWKNKEDVSLRHGIDAVIPAMNGYRPGIYRLGLWIPDGSERLKYNARYAIRCANGNTTWWVSDNQRYGVNILTEIRVD